MSQRIKILSQRIEGDAIIYELRVPLPTPDELARLMLKQTTTYVTRERPARPAEPEGLYDLALKEALEENARQGPHIRECECWTCQRMYNDD